MNALPDQTSFMPMTPALRARIEAAIERLVALLDAIDGDPDLELMGDDEPSLGWTFRHDGVSTVVTDIYGDDRELEEENDEDGGDAEWSGDELDYSWVETWGQFAGELAALPPVDHVLAAVASWSVSVSTT